MHARGHDLVESLGTVVVLTAVYLHVRMEPEPDLTIDRAEQLTIGRADRRRRTTKWLPESKRTVTPECRQRSVLAWALRLENVRIGGGWGPCEKLGED